MKKIFLLFIVSILTLNLQAKKLQIIHENWSEAVKKAKKSNKLIIIDFYTTWCGPCKMFSANLDSNQDLKNKLAENFVMLKYNAEKDKNFNLRKKFHVRAYPTFVIVSPKVQYIDRLVGGALQDEKSVERFMTFADGAVKMYKEKTYPKGYNKSLKNTYPTFYTQTMNDTKAKLDKEDLKEYWKNNKDFTSEVSFAVISAFGGSDTANNFYLENRATYEGKFGKEVAEQVVVNMVNRKYSAAIKDKDQRAFDRAQSFALQHLGKEKANIDYMEFRFSLAVKDCPRIQNSIDPFIRDKETSAGMMNSICWQLYQSECTETSLYEKAAQWMESVNPIEQDYAFLDTYACILYKGKKYKEAKTYMDRAIAKAKANDENYEGSTKVLALIEEKIK